MRRLFLSVTWKLWMDGQGPSGQEQILIYKLCVLDPGTKLVLPCKMCAFSEKWSYWWLTELNIHLLGASHKISSSELLIRSLYKFIIWPLPPCPSCIVFILVIVYFLKLQLSLSPWRRVFNLMSFPDIPVRVLLGLFLLCLPSSLLTEVTGFQPLCYWHLGTTISMLGELALFCTMFRAIPGFCLHNASIIHYKIILKITQDCFN